jgi:hypothetical protein
MVKWWWTLLSYEMHNTIQHMNGNTEMNYCIPAFFYCASTVI